MNYLHLISCKINYYNITTKENNPLFLSPFTTLFTCAAMSQLLPCIILSLLDMTLSMCTPSWQYNEPDTIVQMFRFFNFSALYTLDKITLYS